MPLRPSPPTGRSPGRRAPLAPDVRVWIRNRRWRVDRVDRFHRVVRLAVSAGPRRAWFLVPFDRPIASVRSERPRRVRAQQALGRLARLVGRAFTDRTIVSAVDASVVLLPHQLEPVLALQQDARRVLVADEVGLGKTIQAGLAIAEVVRRDPDARVLAVVPASLRDQWVDELSTRFGIAAGISDRHHLDDERAGGAFGDDPWLRPGVRIASLDFLKQPHVLASLPIRLWDLVVIDEAHEACGDSARHDAANLLARRSRRLMLLTATPHSGDAVRFARLLGLGALPADDDPLVAFRRTRADVGAPEFRRVRWRRVPLSEAETRALAALASFERAVRASRQDDREAALLLLAVLRKRALSTMAALGRSVDRRLAWLDRAEGSTDMGWVQPAFDFTALADEADRFATEEVRGLTAETGLGRSIERSYLRRLRALATSAGRDESKLRHVDRLAARTTEPLVVFTEFRDSLEALSRALAGRRAHALLHGGQSPTERRRELERFLSGEVSILLATDVGGVGLNLQARARWVVSLELPWNPVRLEQRAGRVDRIGQSRPVHVTHLVAADAAETGLLLALARRALAAGRALGEDTAAAGPVGEAVVRTALVGEADADPLHDVGASAAGGTVHWCRAYRRAARAAARGLEWRRALLRHWQAPAGHLPGTAGAIGSRWRALESRLNPRRVLLVFSVPLLDAAGSVIEQHVVAIAVSGHGRRDVVPRAAVEHARAMARARLGPRAARLAHARARQAGAMAARESLLSRDLRALVEPGELQPGLFDRRASRAREAAAVIDATLREDLAARQARTERGRDVLVGRPVLELVFGART